jgi:hypothetical protein
MVSHQDMARSCGGGRKRTIDGHEGEYEYEIHIDSDDAGSGGGSGSGSGSGGMCKCSILCTLAIKRGRPRAPHRSRMQ